MHSELPLSRSAGTLQIRTASPAPALLLVEDNETDILFVRRCLAESEIKIDLEVVKDAQSALDLLRNRTGSQQQYVLLTDLSMPGMSGHDLISELRADPQLHQTAVFVLSSSSLDSDIRRAYNQNIAGYFIKNVATRQLKRSVQLVLDYCAMVKLPE